jgi:hypothetical protein
VDFDLGKPREKWEKLWILPMKTHKHMAKVWKKWRFRFAHFWRFKYRNWGLTAIKNW